MFLRLAIVLTAFVAAVAQCRPAGNGGNPLDGNCDGTIDEFEQRLGTNSGQPCVAPLRVRQRDRDLTECLKTARPLSSLRRKQANRKSNGKLGVPLPALLRQAYDAFETIKNNFNSIKRECRQVIDRGDALPPEGFTEFRLNQQSARITNAFNNFRNADLGWEDILKGPVNAIFRSASNKAGDIVADVTIDAETVADIEAAIVAVDEAIFIMTTELGVAIAGFFAAAGGE